jgi:hypothetical protein
MFHIVLEWSGVPEMAGAQAAIDIAEEFRHHPWHQNVTCIWKSPVLRLEADNDYDENGLALMDEFSDAISACVQDAGDGDLRVVSVAERS